MSPQNQAQRYELADALHTTVTHSTSPEHVSIARVIILSRNLINFWKIHMAIMALLYTMWLILGIKTGEMEFVITGRGSKNLWLNIVCTQCLVWMHTINVVGTVSALILLNRRIYEADHRGIMSETLERCRKDLFMAIVCSASFYSIMTCYREHSDASTFDICPVILFMFFSHITSLIFKINFKRNVDVIRENRRRVFGH